MSKLRLGPGAKLSIAAVTCASVAGIAFAQVRQTAEGAQQFIRLTAANGSTTLGIPLANGSYNIVEAEEERKQQRCRTDFWGGTSCKQEVVGHRMAKYHRTIHVSKAETVDRCTSRLSYYITPRYSNDKTYVPGIFTINWKNVTEAKQNGTEVFLAGQQIKFYLSSSDLATRFAYAAKFLRDSCDPAAMTGF